MPDVTITVGGRQFEVACQAGEEHYLRAAAELLDGEAAQLVDQIGRMPESRMLLMAGLLLADKTAGAHDQVRALEQRVSELEAELSRIRSGPAPEPRTVEVPVVPQELADMLAELTARAEALADEAEEKAAS
jgi:cell division protein ZapA